VRVCVHACVCVSHGYTAQSQTEDCMCTERKKKQELGPVWRACVHKRAFVKAYVCSYERRVLFRSQPR